MPSPDKGLSEFGDSELANQENANIARALAEILGLRFSSDSGWENGIGHEIRLQTFYSPIGIDIRTNGSMHDIYVADYGSSCVRRLSLSYSEIAENSASHRYVERIPMGCKTSGLALDPDGQWAIVSCSEINAIYKLNLSYAHDGYPWYIPNSWYHSDYPTEAYLDEIGSSATFRYPDDIVVSPDGAFALVAE